MCSDGTCPYSCTGVTTVMVAKADTAKLKKKRRKAARTLLDAHASIRTQ